METRCLWRHLQTWSTVTWGPTSHVPVSSCSAARCAPTLPVNRPRPSLPTRNYPNDTLLGHITVKSVTNRCLVHWTQAHIKVHCFPLKLSWKKGGSSLYGIWFINHSNMSYPPVQPGTLSWLVLLSCKSQWKCVKKKNFSLPIQRHWCSERLAVYVSLTMILQNIIFLSTSLNFLSDYWHKNGNPLASTDCYLFSRRNYPKRGI